MSVETQCRKICAELRKNGEIAEKEIGSATVINAINKIVGSSRLTEFRYMTDYLIEKTGMLEEGAGEHRGSYWLTGADLDEGADE